MENDREEILDALIGMVNQHCSIEGGKLDSSALSDNAHALRLLAKLGKVKIVKEYGRIVVAEWVKEKV